MTLIPQHIVLQSPANNDPLLDLNTQPSLDLQFATSKTLDDRVSGQNLVTFSRSTTGTYVDSNGVIQTAAIDAPRFDHDPDTLESLGLLIEESRANLLTYSEQVDNGVWNKIVGSGGVVTATPNTTLAPNGLLVADTVDASSAVSNGRLEQKALGLTVGQSYTASFYVKHLSGNTDFTIWVPGSSAQSPTLTATTEWQRFSLTFTAAATSEFVRFIQFENGSAAEFAVWGAQAEAGSFPTSYIPTTGSAVTRAADVASITGTNFSSWYNDAATTLYIESPDFPNYANLPNSALVYISDQNINATSVGDGIKFGTGSPDSYNRVFVTEGGVTQAGSNNEQASKFAIALSENDFSYAIDGTSAATDNTVVMPTGMDRLNMTGYGPGLAHLSRLTYYPYRLPNATLQEITS